MAISEPFVGWQTWTTATSNRTSVMVNGPSVVSVAPAKPKPMTPLEWLRSQVDEVCELARTP